MLGDPGGSGGALDREYEAFRHRAAIVAGGIGQTPFLALIREALGQRRYGQPARQPARGPLKITMCYGVRSAEYLALVSDFQQLKIDFRIATEDGSAGRRGRVTEILSELLGAQDRPDRVYTCGPEPMMEAVATLAAQRGVACDVSLETPMACGIGICFRAFVIILFHC